MKRVESMSTPFDDLGATRLLQHASWLRSLARTLVLDPSRAEDLVQETWLAALRRRPAGDRSLRPWLATVLRNFARKAARDESSRNSREIEGQPPAELPDPAELCEELEAERVLTDELAALDEPYRSTLLLRYYRGLEPTEIARRQGIPAGTVRWRVKRGLDTLRERLDERFDGERRSWCLLLTPLVRSKVAATSLVGPSISCGGMLTMKKLLEVGAGLAVLLLAYVGLSVAGLLPDALTVSGARGQEVAVAFRPIAEEPEVAAVAPAKVLRQESAPEVRRPIEAAIAEPSEERVTTCRLEAVIVDSAGYGLGGALLRVVTERGPGEGAVSAGDGSVALDVEVTDEKRGTRIEAFRTGYASHSEIVRLAAGEVVNLGRIALELGGRLRGRVVDEQGLGVVGAIITTREVGERRQELEMGRYLSAVHDRLNEAQAPVAISDDGGDFLLSGLGKGFVHLWAEADGFLPTYTEPVEVRVGIETYGAEIVLAHLGPANLVRGRVVTPDGAPVPFAVLDYKERSSELGYGIANQKTVDADGSFEFVLPPDATLTLTARDPEDRFGPVTADGVKAGRLDVELRLVEGEPLLLAALDPAQGRLGEFRYEILSASDEQLVLQSAGLRDYEDGVARFRLPERAYLVKITAPLHEEVVAGPFEPHPSDEVREIVLESVPGLLGRVVDDEGGVRGAKLELRSLVPAEERVERNGTRCWQDPIAIDGATSDEDGRFHLTIREPGGFVVRAEHEGYAAAEYGPFTAEPGARLEELELRLGPGGAIEGRVYLADGADPTGSIVLAHRGDGEPRTRRVGADGLYRFDHLTPGSWRVELREEDVLYSYVQQGPSLTDFEDEVRWNCLVEEGRTCFYDVRVGDPDAYRLEGRVTFDRAVPTTTVAWLAPPGASFLDNLGRWPTATVDPAGAFTLGVEEAGDYRLVLKSTSLSGEWVLVDEVRLEAATTTWEQDLALGSVAVEGVSAPEGDDLPPFVYRWNGPGRLMYLGLFAPSEDDVVRLDFVPAGPGALVRPTMEAIDDPAGWEVLSGVRVVAGEEARVVAPR